MAEENDLSRTEPASAKRLQDARRAGDVPRSAEFSAWLVLLVGLAALSWLAPHLFDTLIQLVQVAFKQAAQPDPLSPTSPLFDALTATFWAVSPLLALVFVAALLAPLLLSGWTASSSAPRMQWSRVRWLGAFVRRMGVEGGFDGLLALGKFGMVAGAVVWAIWPAHAFDAVSGLSPTAVWLGQALLILVASLALTAVLDAGWRWWRYLRRHAMTWQEVLAEARESEVSPEVRAQLRARQQQAGQGTRGRTDEVSRPPRSIDEVIG